MRYAAYYVYFTYLNSYFVFFTYCSTEEVEEDKIPIACQLKKAK